MIEESQPDKNADPDVYRTLRILWGGRLQLFWCVFLFALLFYTQFQFWKQPSNGDRANWDYFAQVISRGGAPYRDVVNIKSPGSAYIGAAAIIATRPFGVRDIFAIRITFIILAAFVVAFTYLVTLDTFGSRSTALFAAVLVLSFDLFSASNAGGTQPKTPMVLFGLVALWATVRDRPVVAGCFGMLAVLCWQPGLLFVGAAGLGFSRYLTKLRDRRLIRLAAGAILPFLMVLGYFWYAGVLTDFYNWTVVYTATVYAPHELRSLGNFFDHISLMLEGNYRSSQAYFYVAPIGLFIALARELRIGVSQGLNNLLARAPGQTVIIAPVVYFAFCMIDIQGAADVIPLIPFVAIFAALALVWIVDRLCSRLARGTKVAKTRRLVVSFVILWVLFFNVRAALLYKCRVPTLADQDSVVAEVVSLLEPGDKIFVHGQTEILVLGRLTNATKYFFFDRDKDRYLDVVEPGGFAGWFERLKAERPRIVALSRLEGVYHAKDFLDWVSASYEPRFSSVFVYYVRRDNIATSDADSAAGSFR